MKMTLHTDNFSKHRLNVVMACCTYVKLRVRKLAHGILNPYNTQTLRQYQVRKELSKLFSYLDQML